MGQIYDEAKEVYRPFVTDGVPSSGPNEPSKDEIIDLFKTVEDQVDSAISGVISYPTAASLPASTGSGKIYLVTSDPVTANNGYWQDQAGGNVILTDLNNALKGNDGLLAAATDAQLDSGTDNTVTVTPAGLSHLGLTKALAIAARPGMGDLTYLSQMTVTLGGGATTLKRGARDLTHADETDVGAQGAAGQTMAGTTIIATVKLPAWFSRTFPGASIDFEGTIRFDAASFITDKTLVQPVNPVAASYRDGSPNGNIGTMVSSAVDATDLTLYRRKANFTVSNYLATVALSAQVPTTATNTAAHAFSWQSVSMRCVAVPSFAAYTPADVNEALSQFMAQHDDVGPIFGEVGWQTQPSGGAVALGTTGISIAAGSSGAGSNILGSWQIPASVRPWLAGATPYIGLLINTSSTFTRDLFLRMNLNVTQVGLSNSQMIQVTPTQRLYLLRSSTAFAGTETQIQYVARLNSTQSNGNVGTGVTETFTVADCFLAFDWSGSNMLDASASARRVLYARLLDTASTNALARGLTFSGEMVAKGLANSQISNNATLITDSVGAAGFATNGVSGASSFIDRYINIDSATSAALNERTVRLTAIYQATANWLTERGFGVTNKLFVNRGGTITRNDGTQISLAQNGTLITRIVDLVWDSTITAYGLCAQISSTAGSTGNHSIQLVSWSFNPQSPLSGKATSQSDEALVNRGYISAPASDGNYYAQHNGAWTAFTPGGGGGSSRPTVLFGVIGQSNEAGAVSDSDRSAYPQAFQSNKLRGSFTPYGPNSGAVGRGSWWPYVVDALHDWGYDAHILNGAIGSQSFMRHACGYLPARASNAAYYQKRPAAARNSGYYGDLIVMSNKVFRCTTGNDIAAFNDGGPMGWIDGRQTNLDYIDSTSGLLSASSDPGGWASASVGSTINDGGIVWTCVGDTSSGVYAGLSTNSVFTEAQKGFGFDPFGTLQRLHAAMQEVRADRKVVYIANGQADAGISSTLYSAALQSIGNFFLSRGYEIAIGLTMWTPTSTTGAYDGLKAGRTAAITALQGGSFGASVHSGADLYTLMGTTGPMGGASFTGSISGSVLTRTALAYGAIEVGHKIVDAAGTTVLGTVTADNGDGTYALSDAVATSSEAMKSVGQFFRTDGVNVNIHINGAGAVGPDIEEISCVGKYVSDSLKEFIPEVVA